MKDVFYFCDGKCKCSASPRCGMSQKTKVLEPACYHTAQSEHAINGPIGENADKRPFFIDDPVTGIIWEGFIGNGKVKMLSDDWRKFIETGEIECLED